MGSNPKTQRNPQVRLLLELDASLEQVLDSGTHLHEQVRRTIVREVVNIMAELGIPGECEVEIASLQDSTKRLDRFMHIVVNGHLCRYSDELLQRVFCFVRSISPDTEVQPDNILEWLQECFHDLDESYEKPVEFLTLACLETIKKRPSILLGVDQAVTYSNTLKDLLPATGAGSDQLLYEWPNSPSWLWPVLSNVLDMKISLADNLKVAQVVAKGFAQHRSQEEISEDLIDALQPDIVEIQLPRDYLIKVTTFDPGEGPDLFASLRVNLFQELGVRYPPFRFVPVENLIPSSLACKIHHLTMLPWVDTSLNPLNFLVSCFTTDLRENSYCFVNHGVVRNQLEQLRLGFPALVRTAEAKVPITLMTRIFRSLVIESLSIKTLILLLELLLEYTYDDLGSIGSGVAANGQVGNEQSDIAVIENYLDAISFVRSGLKNQIRQKYAGGMKPLEVYQLGPKIEALLGERLLVEESNQGGQERVLLDEEVYDRVIDVIRTQVRMRQMPVLTSKELRSFLWKVIAPELPRVPVLCHEDLPSDTDIYPQIMTW